MGTASWAGGGTGVHQGRNVLRDLADFFLTPGARVLFASQLMQHVEATDGESRRAAARKGWLRRGERACHHQAQMTRIAEPHFDLFVTRIEEPMQWVVLERVGGFCPNILEISGHGIPVIDGQFEAIDLLDIVFVGHLGDIAQDVMRQRGAGDLDLELRDVEVPLLERLLA